MDILDELQKAMIRVADEKHEERLTYLREMEKQAKNRKSIIQKCKAFADSLVIEASEYTKSVVSIKVKQLSDICNVYKPLTLAGQQKWASELFIPCGMEGQGDQKRLQFIGCLDRKPEVLMFLTPSSPKYVPERVECLVDNFDPSRNQHTISINSSLLNFAEIDKINMGFDEKQNRLLIGLSKLEDACFEPELAPAVEHSFGVEGLTQYIKNKVLIIKQSVEAMLELNELALPSHMSTESNYPEELECAIIDAACYDESLELLIKTASKLTDYSVVAIYNQSLCDVIVQPSDASQEQYSISITNIAELSENPSFEVHLNTEQQELTIKVIG